MSSFGAKRKPRVIKVSDKDDRPESAQSSDEGGALKTSKSSHATLLILFFADGNKRLTMICNSDPSKPVFKSKTGQKSFRKSALRKAFSPPNDGSSTNDAFANPDEEESDGPAVVRPNASRNNSSSRNRRVPKSSRVSFGTEPGDDEDGEGGVVKPPKKATLGKRVLENNATKKGIATRGLPVRSFRDEDEDDRPKYSKEYLNELQSSTPNTPQNAPALHMDGSDGMDLDPSELEGALVVESSVYTPTKPDTRILSEAEIHEKKERRARLAMEQDFLSVEDDDDGDYLNRKKKDDTRLKPEDEDFGEGFDDLVEDGGLSLGKRAEKERRKRDKQQMAELIIAAEGHTSDSSEDSDAERRIAYEAAQTRAGMDGLKKPKKDRAQELLQVPLRITPLPSLSECIARLQISLKAMENEINGESAVVQQLRNERADIVKRESEVQALLDETGKKYQEAIGQGKFETSTVKSAGPGAELMGERGLESIGTTPRRTGDEMEEDY